VFLMLFNLNLSLRANDASHVSVDISRRVFPSSVELELPASWHCRTNTTTKLQYLYAELPSSFRHPKEPRLLLSHPDVLSFPLAAAVCF